MISTPLNQVIQGDCIKVLHGFPENSVDLICTDPPYNIAKDGKLTKKDGIAVSTKEAWGNDFKDDFTEEEYAIFMLNLSEAFDRVLSEQGSILMFFDRSKPYYLKPFYEKFTFRNMIVFVKNNPAPHFRKNNYRSAFEQCAWFSREKYNINFLSQKKMKNVFHGSSGVALKTQKKLSISSQRKETDHPTEKYGWMIHPLIERHSNHGDVVLDPMCGSGTTLLYAKKLQRNYIGIDIEIKWVETSRNRLIGLSSPLSTFMNQSELSIDKQTKRID